MFTDLLSIFANRLGSQLPLAKGAVHNSINIPLTPLAVERIFDFWLARKYEGCQLRLERTPEGLRLQVSSNEWTLRLEKDLQEILHFVAEWEREQFGPTQGCTDVAASNSLDPQFAGSLTIRGLSPLRFLGTGGHSECFLCRHTQYGLVTVKRFHTLKTLQQEDQHYIRLGKTQFSPHRLLVFPELNVLVLSYVDGIPLPEADREELVSYLPEIAGHLNSALKHFQTLNPILMHRDIKPKNLLWSRNQVSLIDYSSAETISARCLPTFQQETHHLKLGAGAYSFKAFEQLTRCKRQDNRVDVFGASATIFWCLYGVPPFRNLATGILTARRFFQRRYELLLRCLSRDYPELANSLAAGLAINARYRPQTLSEIERALHRSRSKIKMRNGTDLV